MPTVSPRSSPAGALDLLPWLGVGLFAALTAADSVVWVACRLVNTATGHGWTGPAWRLTLALALPHQGPPAWTPGAGGNAVLVVAATIGSVVVLVVAVPVVVLGRRLVGPPDPARAMATIRDVRDLTRLPAAQRAVRLRPHTLSERRPTDLTPADIGVPLGALRRKGTPLRASWEDVVLAVMAPRAGKTTALAVRAVLEAPGWAVATSNKHDLWAATSALRSAHGRVWVFDPQSIVYEGAESPQPPWWWSPLTQAQNVADAHRLADHFVQEVRGEEKADFWCNAARDLLISLLLAAARAELDIRQVGAWLDDPANPEPANILDKAGETTYAASLRGRQHGAPETRDGIYETARTATTCLRDPAILRWVVPGSGTRRMFDVEEFIASTDTIHLLSKDGAGSAAPLVAGLTDAILRAAVRAAVRAGGRLDPPGIVVLDEAANVCRIPDLPELYSHFGSRGIVPITILQSYKQGVRVWGEHGMDALWSAATIKVIGAGIDDPRLAGDLSRLIGDHEVDVRSTTCGDRTRSTQVSTRRQPILEAAQVRALPKGTAILLATGIRAALITLQPWFTGPDRDRIASAIAAADHELTRRANAEQDTPEGTAA